ncbi:transposase [Listeria welshimeri]|uniref:Transposase n=1 Tax=Listeria booriae TaxID=1552123 RepID=A0A7X1DSX7_9LIST|nr:MULTISPECIES: helix-turn-helix domain-containing protein [Listeria]EFQ9070445.1 transposase [Listeria monocytogenes]EJV0514945.1 transposase [Listeria monocytogenes]EKZ4625147.1 transposase [Listeria monocytogenes]MBC1290229.1 transposase [Listeria welshimeri]MBC1333640.1 transposase [Listeria booriae]
MVNRIHYSAELKWKAVELFLEGESSPSIAKKLGIKNPSQIRIWMSWYRRNETYRFIQPVGKQYSFQKGIHEMSEVDRLKLRIKQLEMHNELLGKLKEISRT